MLNFVCFWNASQASKQQGLVVTTDKSGISFGKVIRQEAHNPSCSWENTLF